MDACLIKKEKKKKRTAQLTSDIVTDINQFSYNCRTDPHKNKSLIFSFDTTMRDPCMQNITFYIVMNNGSIFKGLQTAQPPTAIATGFIIKKE